MQPGSKRTQKSWRSLKMNKMTEKQKENTLAFFAEYDLLKKLENAASILPDEDDDLNADSPEMRKMLQDAVSPYDPFPRVGEIRLLSQPERLTYVAVFPWDHCHSLIVPLSRFENPATNRELLAEDCDKKGLFMQVYQCWNARTINNILLAKSWIAGKISPAEQERLNQMMHYSLLGDELPEEIQNRTGAPIYRAEDPRLEYMREATELFAALDAEDLALDDWTAEFQERSQNLTFTAAEEILQAAAGENALSGLYSMDEAGNSSFITGLELEAFEPVQEGTAIPHFIWFGKKLSTDYPDWHAVLFRHAESGDILGNGYLHYTDDGMEVVLQSPISAENTPVIREAKDIQIILRNI